MMYILHRKNIKIIAWILLTTFFIVVLSIGIFIHFKILSIVVYYERYVYITNDVKFLSELTYKKHNGEMTSEQEIFNEAVKMIREAKDIIIVDMFLFNDYTDQDRDFPDLSGKLTKALIEHKQRYPNLQIVFI